MKFSFNEKQVVQFLLLFAAVIFSINAITFIGTFGGGDGMRHYLVSRYSWKHPEQFLYSWGKPFFTLISSPFSQFGLKGIKLFNSALAVLFGLIAYKVANKLQLKNTWLIVVLSLFSPLTVQTANSGLTEPMFALIIIFCAWLFMNEKYLWATLLISFLPFVRSEGNMILPLFAIILFIRKKFWTIPLLAFGTIAYSIVGYFYYHDILWIQTQNPYKGLNYDIYGQGPLLHYVMAYNEIFGVPLTILYVVGLPVVFYLAFKKISSIKNIFNDRDLSYEELFLLHGSFIVYFVAHSIFWWKGLYGSLGLTRSMAGVVPLAGFACLQGMNLILHLFRKWKISLKIITTGVALVVVLYAFSSKFYPMDLFPEEKVIQQSGDWFKTTDYHPPKIFFLYPYLAYSLNLDPFDTLHVQELFGFYNEIQKHGIDRAVPVGSLIFWDSHFGANEAHIPLDSLMYSPYFKFIKGFAPKERLETLGGYNFEVYVFERVKNNEIKLLHTEIFDLENESGFKDYGTVKEGMAHSGKNACVLNENIEYSATYLRNTNDLKNLQYGLSMKVNLFLLASNGIKDATLVFSIDDKNGKNLRWEGKEIKLVTGQEWQNISFDFSLNPALIKPENTIKIYIWNKGKETFLMDDLGIDIYGSK